MSSVGSKENWKGQTHRQAQRAASVIGRKRMRESGRPRAVNGKRKLLFLVLKLIQPVVNSAQAEQFLVRSLLAQTPLVKHKNPIRVLNRAQPMRDHHRRAPFEQP